MPALFARPVNCELRILVTHANKLAALGAQMRVMNAKLPCLLHDCERTVPWLQQVSERSHQNLLRAAETCCPTASCTCTQNSAR